MPVVRQNVVIAEPVLLSALVSMDFFTVLTLTGRVLFVLVLMAHDRRRIVHVNESRPEQRRPGRQAGVCRIRPDPVSPEVGGLHHRHDRQAA